MKKSFRYDYNNKLFLISLVVSVAFLAVSFVVHFEPIAFGVTLGCSVLGFLNTFFIIKRQGISLNKKRLRITIVDEALVRNLKVSNIKYATYKQIEKENKGNAYGFFHEFFHPSTYMSDCKYVYNHGKVYNICFHMTDGSTIESYFGWMYREKSLETVEAVEAKLEKFIDEVNCFAKNQEKAINMPRK